MQLLDDGVHLIFLFRQHTIAHYRFEQRMRLLRFHTKSLSDISLRKSGHRTDRSCLHTVCELELFSVVAADLVHLFLPSLLLPVLSGNHCLNRELPARDFHMGQPVSLRIPCNLIDSCPEFRMISSRLSIGVNPFKELLHAFHLQRSAKETGKQLSLPDQMRNALPRNLTGLQILLHGFLTTHGNTFHKGIPMRQPEIHAFSGQALLQLLIYRIRIRSRLIELIHKQKDRDMIPGKQLPQRHRVPLHPVRCAYHQHCQIQYLQCTFHFRRKIHMSRRI